MKLKQKFAALVVVLAIALFGVVSIQHAVESDSPKPQQNAAFYCAPYVNYACYLHYQNCGPYQWNRWLNEWIDRCGGVLF